MSDVGGGRKMNAEQCANEVRSKLTRIREEREKNVNYIANRFCKWLTELNPIITALYDLNVDFGNEALPGLKSPLGVLVGAENGCLLVMKLMSGEACVLCAPPDTGEDDITFENEMFLKDFILDCDLETAAAGFNFVREVHRTVIAVEHKKAKDLEAFADKY
jgi:hypothetical protein